MLAINTNNFSVSESREKYDKAFQNFPQKEMYRMFIDKDKQHLGEDAFDKDRPDHRGEPGYKAAMLKAFEFVRDTLGQRMDVDYLIQLHAKCTEGVKFYKYVGSYSYDYKEIKKGIKESNYYGFNIAESSDESKIELEEEKLLTMSDRSHPDYLSYFSNGRIHSSYTGNVTEAQAREKVNSIFSKYYKELEESTNKIRPMNRLCRALEMYHIFEDGNQRTIAFPLLNKMLLESDFSACILDDPYIFDGYCCELEMDDHIQKGMDNFKSFKIKS